MGAADIVPGVSGGTIAFITGIYQTLINSLRAFKPNLVSVFRHHGAKAVWRQINGSFLLILGSGILVSIFFFAQLITYFLTRYPEHLWAFFFGLIVSSGYLVASQIGHWRLSYFLTGLLGLAVGVIVSVLAPIAVEPTPVTLVMAGSIAICAMILPGISGSFLLLMMGLYPIIIDAIRTLDWLVIGQVGLGAVSGLLLFSHLLGWLLERHYNAMMAFLTGILFGSLMKVWPWKETISSRLNSKGELVALQQSNLLPEINTAFAVSILAMLIGLTLVITLARINRVPQD